MSDRLRIGLVILFASCSCVAQELPSIAQMPDMPKPFVLRDWKKVATDFDRFVFDASKDGQHLPLYWEESSREVNGFDGFGLPSYVGDSRQNPQSNAHEAITTMSAVLGGTLVGLDKSEHAAKLRAKFHRKDGIGLYLNHFSTTGDSFWYDTLPSLLFLHLYSHYPEIPGYRDQLISTANVWRDTMVRLGASENTLADFDHTGFDFAKKRPIDRGWKEADVAAGIACIEYLAYLATDEPKYKQAASWALDWMAQREENPFYENLAPYGAYTSARLNAEQGTHYPTRKFIEWTLNGKNPRKWGAILEKWNNTEVYGLIGSVYPRYEYAFTMNSFQAVGVMAPIARYEERYARDIAKWILHVAVNGRYFYPNAWPAEGQSSWQWAAKHDPDFCIPYEGIRKQGTTRDYPEGDQVRFGKIDLPNTADPEKKFVLTADDQGRVSYAGKLTIPPGSTHRLLAKISHRTKWNQQPVRISLSKNTNDPLEKALEFRDDGKSNFRSMEVDMEGEVFLRIEAENLNPKAKITVDDLLVETRFKNPPHVGGDPTVHGWGATDLGLYGGSAAAFLGAMVEPSNVKGIILIDPIATDMMPPTSYPTKLIYNPFPDPKAVTLNVGKAAKNLYDALSNHTVSISASGETTITITPRQAAMIVMTPVNNYVARGGKLYCDDIVIDYHYTTPANQ